MASAGGLPDDAERAYDYAHDHIVQGSWQRGRAIDDQQVAERLGVGVETVREAVVRLSALGFVDLLPDRSAVVRRYRLKDAEDIVEIRIVLETFAASKAFAEREGLLWQLTSLHEQMEEAAAAGVLARHSLLDRAFHTTLVAAADNALLTAVYRYVRERESVLTTGAVTPRSGARLMREGNARHAQIVKALRGQEMSAFVKAMNDYLRWRAAAHRELFGEDG